ncbi:carboxymuconolactone decarboxylase family protein [Rhodococcus sp. BP-252]|nr:carboxymuconolactone decarboxylase family protein [Rhodococcus sp. BP-320]MBY6415080.1 carboxymuconolactone decarboxylase family protein [Rhodococcus sp. BP-321]MBY6421403.1 carboxymuconolactone decarboxylase family protein [Rhodococcus sp. BP-324]MBY6425612.1 carboxymuconolactone decarboxylase family protein [Rhodococcus sp. BP-323]MBY6429976.1 carboxymuconolactone decarboxylase family protein [Rhodococcus sp. BP-322]MBY6438795.1 carboxymuconolactone decarboxylase family protein [Rhodococc
MRENVFDPLRTTREASVTHSDSDDAHSPVLRVLIDKHDPEVFKAQVAVAKAVRAATHDAGMDRRFVELVNVRVSQINRCAYCLDVHGAAAVAAGETPQRLSVLPAWRDTTLFDDRERAALTLAESVTTLPDSASQDRDYAFSRKVLSDKEISALCWVAIAMNAFNRISIVSRHTVRPQQ